MNAELHDGPLDGLTATVPDDSGVYLVVHVDGVPHLYCTPNATPEVDGYWYMDEL